MGCSYYFCKILPNQTKWKRFPRFQQLSITILLEPDVVISVGDLDNDIFVTLFYKNSFCRIIPRNFIKSRDSKKIFYFFMISDQYALFFCIHPYLLQFFKTSSTNTCYMYKCHGLFSLFISWSSVRLSVIISIATEWIQRKQWTISQGFESVVISVIYPDYDHQMSYVWINQWVTIDQ